MGLGLAAWGRQQQEVWPENGMGGDRRKEIYGQRAADRMGMEGMGPTNKGEWRSAAEMANSEEFVKATKWQ